MVNDSVNLSRILGWVVTVMFTEAGRRIAMPKHCVVKDCVVAGNHTRPLYEYARVFMPEPPAIQRLPFHVTFVQLVEKIPRPRPTQPLIPVVE
jgi:hypothetical protein